MVLGHSRQHEKLRDRLGRCWLTCPDYRAVDVLASSVFTVYASLNNQSEQIRLLRDSRYQPASEPADPRWIGPNPPGHGSASKQKVIC